MSKKGYKQTEEHIREKNNSRSIKLFYKNNPNSNCGFQKGNQYGKMLKGKKKNYKIWNKGLTKQDNEQIRKSSIKMKGENNPSWQGGIQFEPYTKEFNDKFKRLIRKRDNQVCMICGVHREKISKTLCIHHINYDKKLSIPQNCISLCKKCHCKTNMNRIHWMKFFQSLLSERYGYEYKKQEVILYLK